MHRSQMEFDEFIADQRSRHPSSSKVASAGNEAAGQETQTTLRIEQNSPIHVEASHHGATADPKELVKTSTSPTRDSWEYVPRSGDVIAQKAHAKMKRQKEKEKLGEELRDERKDRVKSLATKLLNSRDDLLETVPTGRNTFLNHAQRELLPGLLMATFDMNLNVEEAIGGMVKPNGI